MNSINHAKLMLESWLKKDKIQREIKMDYIKRINNGLADFYENRNEKPKLGLTNNTNINLKPLIENILTNNYFPLEFRQCINVLLDTTENQNLFLCYNNLKNIQLEKKKHHLLAFFDKDKNITGSYYPSENKIVYSNDDSLFHEILHMSSSIKRKITWDNNTSSLVVFSGFERVYENFVQFRGFNEGYTELLNRRKFFEKNYDTNSYTINIYTLRLLELLLKNKKDFETAYFNNDIEFIYDSFKQYGNNKEFFEIIKYLDLCTYNGLNIYNIQNTITLAQNIVKRTNDRNKIENSEIIVDEFYKNNPKMKTKKLY